MGTLPEVPAPGLICLKGEVSEEFEKHLANTEHSSADQFLEHLFELFSKTEENARCLQIRLDLAQKFSAMVQGGQFQNSNDLMTFLLQLHTQHAESNPSPPLEPVKQAQQDRVSFSPMGRKSRKSQPKRNVKHQVLLESPDNNGSSSHGVENTVEAAWRERSVSSEEKESSVVEDGEISAPFDLSVVKQEVIEDEDQTRETNSKGGPQHGSQPVCLSLHKPKFASNTGRFPYDRANTGSSYQAAHSNNSKENTAVNAKMSKAKLNWRSHSEPHSHLQEQTVGSFSQRSGLLKRSEERYPVESRNGGAAYQGSHDAQEKSYMEKEESNGYNYVLTSLASDNSENSLGSSLPASPMQVPVKYPKSIHYVLSSDEDEAQDLSYSSNGDEQPQNLTVAKPLKPNTSQASTKGENIKYDSNANAVAISPLIAQLDKPKYIAQPPFSVPQNLIFNDHRSVNNELISQPQVYQVPQKAITSSQDPSAIPPPQGILLANPPPHLQLVIGAPPPLATPVYVQPSIIASQSNFHAGTTSLGTIVTSPDATQIFPKPLSAGSDSQGEELSPGRRKRKRIDDTTLFRDPPETSLPFNGPNKYRFYCDVCDTGFTRRYTFNRHKCKGRVEKHYCQLCDKAYLSKYKLKDHILVKHEGQTVSCPDCGKKFSSRSSMEMHKKQQHEGQFSIWCKVCGKGFNHTGHYYGHMNKHTNTKPFWCQQCGKRFYGSSYLHNHKQVCRGNNELNYSCTLCDRKFKCELYLKKHMKTHENVPIIADPSVAKISGIELSEVGVGLPVEDLSEKSPRALNGDPMVSSGQAVFPNGPDNSDSNSGLLVIDENMNGDDLKMKSGVPTNHIGDSRVDQSGTSEIKA